MRGPNSFPISPLSRSSRSSSTEVGAIADELVQAFRQSANLRGGALIGFDLVKILFFRGKQLGKAGQPVSNLGVTQDSPRSRYRSVRARFHYLVSARVTRDAWTGARRRGQNSRATFVPASAASPIPAVAAPLAPARAQAEQ